MPGCHGGRLCGGAGAAMAVRAVVPTRYEGEREREAEAEAVGVRLRLRLRSPYIGATADFSCEDSPVSLRILLGMSNSLIVELDCLDVEGYQVKEVLKVRRR